MTIELIPKLQAELTELQSRPERAAFDKVQQELSTIRNDLSFAGLTLQRIAKITGLPSDQTMAKLADWVEAHWPKTARPVR